MLLKKKETNKANGAAEYAAENLLGLGNNWCCDAWSEDGDEYTPLTKEDFVKRIYLQTLALADDENYSLWFSDGDIFWGHAVVVYGTVSGGFNAAKMEG